MECASSNEQVERKETEYKRDYVDREVSLEAEAAKENKFVASLRLRRFGQH